MSILILSSTRDASTPYHEWLAGRRGVSLMCAAARGDSPSFYESVKKFKAYEGNGQVELAALALHAERPIETIIARTEPDILRAAALRERLGIRGQSVASALAYRNKIVMKNALTKAEIPCAAYAPLSSSMDLITFAETHGLPVVVKPVDGAGGKDTSILRTSAALADYLEGGIAPNMMVESFVQGDMFHIDAFVVDSQVVLSAVSKYINGALSFQSNKPWGSYVLPTNSPLVNPMLDLTQRMISALPAPEFMVVHAEIWLTTEGKLIPCEIAARTGGSLIARNVQQARGFDLNEIWVKSQAGLDWLGLVRQALATPERDVKGFIIVPPRAGVLLSVDDQDLPTFVDEYKLLASPGQKLEQAQKQADCLAAFMITADDEAGVTEKLLMLADWFEQRAKWQGEAK